MGFERAYAGRSDSTIRIVPEVTAGLLCPSDGFPCSVREPSSGFAGCDASAGERGGIVGGGDGATVRGLGWGHRVTLYIEKLMCNAKSFSILDWFGLSLLFRVDLLCCLFPFLNLRSNVFQRIVRHIVRVRHVRKHQRAYSLQLSLLLRGDYLSVKDG